ncbi:helix-turn-helix transcriptional regulator [Comamonadaceae bacterium PP-2]
MSAFAAGGLAEASAALLSDAVPAQARNEALGLFLRTRRESLAPQRLGLPRVGRRRTPGLRREEVALLADVGVTWYTWLEQGRAIQPSVRALSAIAQALQCSAAETRHLFSLAGLALPGADEAPVCARPSASTEALLHQLGPYPALVQNARLDLVGFNDAYCRLVNVDLHAVPEADRNCLYLALTDANWRACIGDWDAALPRMVAYFRAAMGEHVGEPEWEALLARYMAVSAEFRRIWQRYEVLGIENQAKRFIHPVEGELLLQQTNWWSAPRNGDRLVVYTPASDAVAEALARMARQGGLTVPSSTRPGA